MRNILENLGRQIVSQMLYGKLEATGYSSASTSTQYDFFRGNKVLLWELFHVDMYFQVVFLLWKL